MDIGRTIKDVIFITPWLISLILFSSTLLLIQLILLFSTSLIFIYKKLIRRLSWQTNQL